MSFLKNMATDHPVAHALLILSLVAAVGLAIGRLNIKGIGLGIAGVLFAGIGFGHFGFEIDHTILDYTREFGLILFVYTIGMQVGPGFFSSLQKKGLSLNLMAVVTVALGMALAMGLGRAFHLPIGAIAGLFSGATTNTPALGAAQEAMKSLPGATAGDTTLPALAYAAAYPFGIVGIIATMLFLRWSFQVDPRKEAAAFQAEQGSKEGPLHRMSISVDQTDYDGVRLGDIHFFQTLRVIATRVFHNADGTVRTASPDLPLHLGDIVLVVGEKEHVEQLCRLLGKPARIDLMKAPGQVHSRDLVVTRKEALGQSLRDLDLEHLYQVAVSRVTRGDVEMTALPDVRLQFGDRVRIVGEANHIAQVTPVLGDSRNALNHTHFIPVFIGIALGVILGSIPVQLFGMPAPVTLGLAGGPLVVSILLSRAGRIGPLVWHMPLEANLALRELGIVLFLSCVGLKAGSRFLEILLHGDGLLWMAIAAAVTLVPLLIIGFVARRFFRENFMTVCGLLAGTMTDPPALAFANNISGSDAPSVGYATVYPLTMLLRILAAQAIVLFFH